MNKMSLLRSSVLFLVTLSGVGANANAPTCGGLFTLVGLNNVITPMAATRTSFMNGPIYDAIKQLRNSNPKADNIPYLAQQVPTIISKLYVQLTEATTTLSDSKMRYDRNELDTLRGQTALKAELNKQYQKLVDEAFFQTQQGGVTYQWYMNFFLKSLLFSDVTARIQSPEGSALTVDQLTLRVKQMDSQGKALFTTNMRETAAHSALSTKFASLVPDANFTRHRHRFTLIPILFRPDSGDILRAEALDARFISLTGRAHETQNGKFFPLEYAGEQVLESNRVINPYGVQ